MFESTSFSQYLSAGSDETLPLKKLVRDVCILRLSVQEKIPKSRPAIHDSDVLDVHSICT
jgi:hypothetical protein